MAFSAPIASPEEALELGKTVGSTALTVASIRVRRHLRRVAPPEDLTPEGASEELKEITISIAERLQTINPALANGVASESSDGVSVSLGFDSFKGISNLVAGETEALDKLYASFGFGTIVIGV